MKTTVDITRPLLLEAKRTASREHTTLRALIEEGLRRVLQDRNGQEEFRLPDASFPGRGLRPELRDESWERIRDLAYEGRGS